MHAIDMTERKLAEERLKRTEILLRSSIEGSMELLVVSIDKDFRCLYLNRAYHDKKLDRLGIDIRMGDCLLDNVSSDLYLQQSIPYYRKAFEGESSRVVEHYDHDDTAFETVYNPIRDDDGNIIGATAFTTDVTQIHATEALLRSSNDRYEALLNSISEGFTHGDGEDVITFANPAADRVFGLGRGELIGRSVRDFIDAETGEILARENRKRRKGQATDYTIPIVRSDGERRWLLVSASPLRDDAGAYAGSSTLFRDITEQKAADEKLRELARHRELLMKELQHRVKNTLALVSSLIAVAKDELSDDKAVRVFTDTEARINAMSAIYERLYLSDDLETIDIGRYIEDLSRAILDAYVADAGRIRLDTRAAALFLGTKEAISLGLILNELLTNCLKHAFPGSAKGMLRVLLEKSDGRACLTVADDGIGLGEESLFVTSQSMGVTLVRTLTEQIHGTLSVRTGGGTSVSVCFEAD